jgi:hypothetical protein
VPVTGPGLPLLMAAFEVVAGHCAAFWVAPLSGGLLVWLTFVVGRHAGPDRVALGAAWLLATSPTFLAMTKSVMSDVPAATAWALATACLLRPSRAGALAAGLAASAAILIRPNLVPVAVMMALWALRFGIGTGRADVARTLAFAAGVVPGCLFVAWFNHALYGSPLSSGYGDARALFSVTNVPVNVRQFTRWLVETQSPLLLAGVLALVLPVGRLWRSPAARRAAPLLAVIAAAVFACYVAYTPFQAWWFLRFLLPAWPALCVGTALAVLHTFDGRPWTRRAAAALLIALGFYGVRVAIARGVYPPGEGERRYATIAAFVARATEPGAVIVTGQEHSGSIRYYAGRLTLRFDRLDPGWLDGALEWLAGQGRRPYILLEDWERPLFEQRFGATSAVGRLPMAPVLAYRAHRIPGTIFLFDPVHPEGPTVRPPPVPDPRPRCPAPAPSTAYGSGT